MSEHQSLFKNRGKDLENSRKTRTDNALSLRRDKREEIASKRRNFNAVENEYVTFSSYFYVLFQRRQHAIQLG
jgi:hypothetical protein